MKAARKILNNMVFLSAAEIASKGITTITIIYLARVLNPDGLGTISFINSILAYIVAFTSLGIETIATREVTKNQNLSESYVNNVFTFRFILSAIGFAGLVIFIQFTDLPFKVQLLWYISGLNIFSLSLHLNWYFVAIEKMQIIALRQLLIGVLNFIGIILFIHNPEDILYAIIINSSAFLINTVLMLLYYFKNYYPIRFTIDYNLIKNILKSALPLGFSFILITLYNNIGISLLGFIKGEFETGLFSAAYKIHALGLMPLGIIQTVFFPIISRQETNDDRIKIASKYALMQYIVGIFYTTLVFIYSHSIIEIIYGKEYLGSVYPLQILMITLLLQFINISLALLFMAWNKEKVLLLATILTTISNLTINLFLIPQYGAVGAAFTALMSEAIMLIILIINTYKLLKWLPYLEFIKILPLSIISIFISYILFQYTSNLLIATIVAIVLYPFIILSSKVITIQQIREYIKK